MGQQISNCKTGTEPSIGSLEPHIGESRKRRLPGTSPKSLLLLKSNSHNDEATASTGLSSSKTSFSPTSRLESRRGTTGNNNDTPSTQATSSDCCPITTKEHIQYPLALRYTISTRNLQNPIKKDATTTMTSSISSAKPSRSLVDSGLQQQHTQGQRGFHKQPRKVKPLLFRAPTDKRSHPVKFPCKRQTFGCQKNCERNDTSANPDAASHSHENLQVVSYLARMYDSRTWEMYRRITTHREKIEAFNAANASGKQQHENNDDDRICSASHIYMSDPVQRVTNSSTMEGGFDYDNFYDPGVEDDDDSRGEGAAFLLEDHSAPPYHHHRHCDNGQHHYGGACYYQQGDQCQNNSIETYSEWEHMYGDDVDATNAHGGNHETVFLFDF